MKEKLADLAHDQWSGWMRYLFSKSTKNEDGTVTIPKELVDRWQRQMNTNYEDLSQLEQDSDRKEADKFIKIFKDNTKTRIAICLLNSMIECGEEHSGTSRKIVAEALSEFK